MSAAVGTLFGPFGKQLGLANQVVNGGGAYTRAAYDYRGNVTSGELDLSNLNETGTTDNYTDKAGKKVEIYFDPATGAILKQE